jgi:hypothetical protein
VRKTFLILLVSLSVKATAQNEYAATAFYTALQEMCDDANHGFILYKGEKMPENRNSYTDEYFLKTMLPLADSGKIIWPLELPPYAIFYMEPARKAEDAEKRAGNLRAVIEKVYNEPLYVRTESKTPDGRFKTDSWFYTRKNESRKAFAAFHISVYYSGSRYNVVLEIRSVKDQD